MRTFKRVGLVAALAVVAVGGSAASASAVATTVTVNGSTTTNKDVTLSAGTTQFTTGFVTVTCTTSNLVFNLANATTSNPNPSGPVAGPANLVFSGCSSNVPGSVSVSCNPVGLSMQAGSPHTGNVALGNQACTISLAGGLCTVKTPNPGTKNVPFVWDNGSQSATVAPQSLAYTTSSALLCLGDTGGTATWQKGGGGNVVYVVASGDTVTVS